MEKKIKKYIMLDTQKKKLEANISEIKKELNALTYEINEYMQDNEIKRTEHYEGIGSITHMAPELQPTYLKDDEFRVLEFFRSIGAEDCIKEAIHPQTFKKAIKTMVEEGDDIPEFIKADFFKPRLKINRR